MKKKLLVFLMMASFLASNAQNNIMVNGDFELGDATNWRYLKVVNGVVTNLDAEMSNSDKHGGTYAAKVTFPSEVGFNDCVFDQLPAVMEGTVYTFKAWAKSLNGAFMLRIHATFYDDANTVIGDFNDVTWILSDTYSEHTYTLPAVPAGATKVNIGFRAFSADGSGFSPSTVSCMIDDVQLLEPQIMYENLLTATNADFEFGNVSNWVFWADDALSTATVSSDAHGGSYAAEVFCAGNAKTKVFQRDQTVTAGEKLVFKAWAKLKAGSPALMLRMYATFYNGNTIVADVADPNWILTNTYTQHSFVLPSVPAGATKLTYGFHTFKTDGSGFNAVDVTSIIDDVELLKPIVQTGIEPVNQHKSSVNFLVKSNILHIESINPIQSVSIYTLNGQKIKEIIQNYESVNISNLHAGIYIVKAVSEGIITTNKFIKN